MDFVSRAGFASRTRGPHELLRGDASCVLHPQIRALRAQPEAGSARLGPLNPVPRVRFRSKDTKNGLSFLHPQIRALRAQPEAGSARLRPLNPVPRLRLRQTDTRIGLS